VTASTELRLLERERELAAVDSLIHRAAHGGTSFVVVTGPAGIGKTRFLDAVERRARGAGLDVLGAVGAELERPLAFGGAVQLFEAPLRAASDEQRAELLEGAARLGGELLGFGAGRLAEAIGDSNFAALHGLYWLCVNLAAHSPLALLIDDAHWLDDQTLAWIEYLARRREGVAVLVMAATRPEQELGQRLTRTAIETAGELIELSPLSADAVRDLMQAALDQPADTEFSLACQEATGGNPFLVHELLRTIRQEGIAPDARGAHALRTLGSDRVARAVLVRLHRLSAASLELARAIAILGRGGSLSVAARLAGLDDAIAARAVESLVIANVLAPGPDLRFHHPIVQASIYQDLPAPARALRHREAARLLAETGASASEVATQLLEAEPVGDRWTVRVLRAAAADATARGAPRAAITFLQRALAERAGEDAEILFAIGRAAYAALEIPQAVDALTRALDKAEPAERGAVALELARALLHAGPAEEAVRLLRSELDTGRDLDPDLRLWLEVEHALYAAPLLEAAATTRRFRALEGRTVAELAALGVASTMADTAQAAAALAQRALAGGALVRAPEAQSEWFLAPWMLIRADRVAQAARVVVEALDHSRSTGSRVGFSRASWLQAEAGYANGDLLAAEADARTAYTTASQGGSVWVLLMSGALLAQILADRGELAEAQKLADTLDISMIAPGERLTRTVHYARGYVALLAGHPDHAVIQFEHLNETVSLAPAGRSRFPTGSGIQAIALSRLGRSEQARRVADDELVWARAWGAPRFTGMALRAQAHTLKQPERIQALQAAVAELERTPARLELARALGDFGSTLRRANQRVAAREPLRRALDLARRCRADALANQLHGELTAAGAKPRRDVLTGRDSLTASELRIAEMAATGMTNAQIAQAIFLTAGTVEKHLTSVYAKLGITSRRHLAAALSDGPGNARQRGEILEST
jgi:DNA-binding CsgD family transcriptional regulator